MIKEIFLKAILDGATDYAIFAIDTEGRFLHWNAGAARILGLVPEMKGASSRDLFTPKDRASGVPEIELANALANGRASERRTLVRADASTFWAEGVVTPIYDEAANHLGYLKILQDVTNRHQIEAEVLHAAKTDALTGLANRACFHEQLHEWTVAGARAGRTIILHLIDLDHFKEVNDSLGHQSGDLLLYKLGLALKEVTLETDFVARLGGDEFAVLQSDAISAAAGGELAEKILLALGQSFDLNGYVAHVTPSIGISVAPQDGWTPDELIKKADAALYRVKKNGRNGYGYFTAELDTEAHNRTRDLQALRQSVFEKTFHIAFQPKVSALDETLVALEVLLRCDHPHFAQRPIQEIISLATQCGVMPVISEWVIEESCRQANEWFKSGIPRFRLCVNLCAREVSDARTPEMLKAISEKYELSPYDLIIEITERELIHNIAGTHAVLNRIRGLGFSLTIDDFGAGYSSLNYLMTLPIDIIKLDMSFSAAIPDNARSCIAVKGIINLARSLGLHVVAEGVERADQAYFFKSNGCESMQGYYFSRPLNAEDMTSWLVDNA